MLRRPVGKARLSLMLPPNSSTLPFATAADGDDEMALIRAPPPKYAEAGRLSWYRRPELTSCAYVAAPGV